MSYFQRTGESVLKNSSEAVKVHEKEELEQMNENPVEGEKHESYGKGQVHEVKVLL